MASRVAQYKGFILSASARAMVQGFPPKSWDFKITFVFAGWVISQYRMNRILMTSNLH
jgi:hypothetical protein